MKSLAASFFIRGNIQTTEAKAKELRPYAEKFVTRAKNPTLADRRILTREFSPEIAGRIIARAKNYEHRPGGYTRITKVGIRRHDSARMARIEFV